MVRIFRSVPTPGLAKASAVSGSDVHYWSIDNGEQRVLLHSYSHIHFFAPIQAMNTFHPLAASTKSSTISVFHGLMEYEMLMTLIFISCGDCLAVFLGTLV